MGDDFIKENRTFQKEFLSIAIPVALQSLLQSSFSVVDQVMTGQLGEVSIAGIGLAGKFVSLYSVLLSAIAAVAGIMMAQYIGKKNEKEVGRSFYLTLGLSVGLAALFFAVCQGLPKQIMGLYTMDDAAREAAAVYLQIISLGYIPMAGSLLLATLLRCRERASVPLYVTLFSAALNTVLNYILIFGKMGFPRLGVAGAAWASVLAQFAGFFITLACLIRLAKKEKWSLPFALRLSHSGWKQFGGILAPILICEFFWSLGENVYAAIYGHIGTDACAAMTLTNPVVGLFMGALSGISQAAGILTGKRLGAENYDAAYDDAKKMMKYGAFGSLCLSVLLIFFGRYYVQIFKVEEQVRAVGYHLLIVFAVIAPVKVQNMILGGGIIRSGGRTKYIMVIDLIGTWVFGVPLGLLTAFVFDLPITAVYFILSLEECIRFGMSVCVFRKKKWMTSMGSE